LVNSSLIFNPNTLAANHRQGGPVVRLARSLIAQTLAYFSEHEANALEMVRAHLMELVDAKPPLGQGQNLRSAHLLLGRYAPQFNQALQKTLADALSEELAVILPQQARPAKPNAADDALHGMSLSLIDVGEVERALLLDRVAQRFGARYESTLEPLTQRLSVLFGHESPSVHDNPFQPVVLLRAFIAAWELCEWDPEANNDLAQSLQPDSWLDLAPLYAELNATLLKAGVPAQRPLRVRQVVSAPAPLDSGAQGPTKSGFAPMESASPRHSGFAPVDSSAGSTWGALAPVGRTVAAHARQFLQRLGLGKQAGGQGTAGGYSDGDAAARPMMETASPALMGFLGGLQADASAAESHQWTGVQAPAGANVLRQMREHEEIRGAPELDRGTVDALAEVFDYVFADRAIPTQMKVIIGRLQIPVLKAAMIDRDFFLSDKHPARRLVDSLAGASVAWTPAKGEHDPLYVRIEHTVQRVLTEFEDDLSLFVDLLQEFTEFLFETEQQARARVEPVAQKERQGESLDQALAHVDDVVHARIQVLSADAPLAAFLLPFLTNPWRQVMARAWMDEATRDRGFAQTLATMEQLIWSVQPKTTSEDRRQLVAILPEMVRQLNLGLDNIDWNGKPRADFTRRLITTHTLAIRLTQPMPLDSGSAALEEREGKAAMQQLDARRAATQFIKEDAFGIQVQNLQRGMWFDVSLEAGTQIRCRLSWVSPMRTRLLFTNRDGYDAFVRSEREVADMLRAGAMRLLDHEAIVGRAIEKIMVAEELAMAD
jgi:hypothetical protein